MVRAHYAQLILSVFFWPETGSQPVRMMPARPVSLLGPRVIAARMDRIGIRNFINARLECPPDSYRVLMEQIARRKVQNGQVALERVLLTGPKVDYRSGWKRNMPLCPSARRVGSPRANLESSDSTTWVAETLSEIAPGDYIRVNAGDYLRVPPQ